MADQQDARLAGLLRAMTRQLGAGPFTDWFDQRLPGLRAEVARVQWLDDQRLADRLGSRFPGWAVRAGEVIAAIPPDHGIFADSAVRDAREAYTEQGGTVRTLTARADGPVELVAMLERHVGTVVVDARQDCRRATITLRTADESGPAADRVRAGALWQIESGQLQVGAFGPGAPHGPPGDGGPSELDQQVQVTTMQNPGEAAEVYINGARVEGRTSPIEIVATVPEGSILISHVDSGAIEASGEFGKVRATTYIGDLVIDTAPDVDVRTMGGNIELGRTDEAVAIAMSGDVAIKDFGGTARAETQSGNVTVHATRAGRLSAGSSVGNVTVTADPGIGRQLVVNVAPGAGQVSLPPEASGTGPRGVGPDGAREFQAGAGRAGQRPQADRGR